MTKKALLAAAAEVLEVEAAAVRALAGRLDDEFVKAVDLIYRNKSRIIVLGMGKSGLVGRKIAATLASCGTPAMFVHPAEAGHGDLGMILPHDVVLAVSYSGETREILDLLDFIKRIGVKLIVLTGHRHSRIARFSDIILDARVEREAYRDPTADEGDWCCVDVVPIKALKQPLGLQATKADRILKSMPLVKQSRLSVMPLTREQFDHVLRLGAGSAANPRCQIPACSRSDASVASRAIIS